MSERPAGAIRIPEVVLGVFVVAGCALGAVVWQRSSSGTMSIVVAARSIDRGAPITADDLRGAEIGGETAGMISGDQARSLLGQVATVDIAAGEPITHSVVGDHAALAPDEALTSVAIEPGHMPPDLALDDQVRVVVSARSDDTGWIESVLLEEVATVWSVAPTPDGAATVVTLRAPLSLATHVAGAADVLLARVVGG